MDADLRSMLLIQGGKVVTQIAKAVFSGLSFSKVESTETTVIEPKTETKPLEHSEPVAKIALPTSEETTAELKKRLSKELYRAELDLANGLKIAGKPCDCLSNKHTLMLEAASEELVSQDPGNPVYKEIIQWIDDNHEKVTVKAIASGEFEDQYPKMAREFKDFRKRVLGSEGKAPVAVAEEPLSLKEAKKLASEEAAKEVERVWLSQEKK